MHQQNTGQEGESSPYFPLRTTQSAVSFQGNKYTISLQSYSPMQDWWLSFETFTNTYTGMTSLATLTAGL